MLYLTLIYRTIVMFTVIVAALRLMGKRQMGELELNELVVAVMISEMATIPITDDSMSLVHGVVPVVTLLLFELTIAFFSMKSIKFRTVISGKPSIIVENGRINQKEMRKNRLTLDELTEELRTQGITDISTIKYAILEVNGSLSTLPYTAHCPSTYSAHQLEGADNGLPVMLVNDGRVLSDNLKLMGLDENWLDKQIRQRGLSSVKQVFVLSVDEMQNIYFAAKHS